MAIHVVRAQPPGGWSPANARDPPAGRSGVRHARPRASATAAVWPCQGRGMARRVDAPRGEQNRARQQNQTLQSRGWVATCRWFPPGGGAGRHLPLLAAPPGLSPPPFSSARGVGAHQRECAPPAAVVGRARLAAARFGRGSPTAPQVGGNLAVGDSGCAHVFAWFAALPPPLFGTHHPPRRWWRRRRAPTPPTSPRPLHAFARLHLRAGWWRRQSPPLPPPAGAGAEQAGLIRPMSLASIAQCSRLQSPAHRGRCCLRSSLTGKWWRGSTWQYMPPIHLCAVGAPPRR